MQTIPLRKILTLLCPAFASLCLVVGYQRSGAIVAGAVGLLVLLAWLAIRRWPANWTAGLALVVSVMVCVFGVTTGGLAPWLITSAGLSLASWDLILLDIALAGNPLSPQAKRLERAHYRALGLALGVGLLLGLGGRLIHFRIPFIFMLLLMVLAYFSLERLLRTLGREFHQ